MNEEKIFALINEEKPYVIKIRDGYHNYTKIVKLRKDNECCVCKGTINKGDKALYEKTQNYPYYIGMYYCQKCYKLIDKPQYLELLKKWCPDKIFCLECLRELSTKSFIQKMYCEKCNEIFHWECEWSHRRKHISVKSVVSVRDEKVIFNNPPEEIDEKNFNLLKRDGSKIFCLECGYEILFSGFYAGQLKLCCTECNEIFHWDCEQKHGRRKHYSVKIVRSIEGGRITFDNGNIKKLEEINFKYAL